MTDAMSERMSDERLAYIRERNAQEELSASDVSELLAEIDALRADLAAAQAWRTEAEVTIIKTTTAAVQACARAEAAARKVDDGEVGKAVAWLREHATTDTFGRNFSRNEKHGAIADLLTRLSAAKAEAERERDSWRRVAEKLEGEKVEAERRLEAARRALEEAELFIVNGTELGYIHMSPNERDPEHATLPIIREAIRALGAQP